MTDVIKIVNDIKSRNFKPVYFLCGEEAYYIDRISDLIEETVLSIVSVISSFESLFISRPHSRQWGLPMRAKRIRK